MDLKEMRPTKTRRHPWELARIHALRSILEAHAVKISGHILDVGCGDGYCVAQVVEGSSDASATAYDVGFTAEQLESLSRQYPTVSFVQRLDNEAADLMLLLDVIEHVDDDRGFLTELMDRVNRGGHIAIMVPAFGWLYSSHDRFLEHRRRYSLAQLREVIDQCGLSLVASGYLFGAPLLVRMASVMVEKLIDPRGEPDHLGRWSHGPLFSTFVEAALRLDNATHLSLGRQGVNLPGMSAWALCRR